MHMHLINKKKEKKNRIQAGRGNTYKEVNIINVKREDVKEKRSIR